MAGVSIGTYFCLGSIRARRGEERRGEERRFSLMYPLFREQGLSSKSP
jgi:hypothetical protein